MTDQKWATPAALAIPKEGYFKKEEGRYGPLFPKTPAIMVSQLLRRLYREEQK